MEEGMKKRLDVLIRRKEFENRMEDTIELSMQKSPKEGFIRVLAFDVNPETQEIRLTAMKRVTQEEYDNAVDLLEEAVNNIQKNKNDSPKQEGVKDGN